VNPLAGCLPTLVQIPGACPFASSSPEPGSKRVQSARDGAGAIALSAASAGPCCLARICPGCSCLQA